MYLDDLPYTIPDSSFLNNQFNYAAVNDFYVVALDIPGVAFYTQNFSLPEKRMDTPSNFPTPFTDIHLTGTKLSYDPLRFTFMINENFENYKSVSDWLDGIAFPENNQQFINQINKKKSIHPGSKNFESMLSSDIHVIALNSEKKPVRIIEFKSAFPTSLSSLDWNSTDTTVNYMKANLTLSYTYYKLL
jgi:hypothetical protein